MAEYDILVECQVIIDANNEEEAKNIAIKNIQNCLNPYYIEAYAEGQSVKRGKWMSIGNQYEWLKTYTCSECRHSIVTYKCNYCPDCGADMRDTPDDE